MSTRRTVTDPLCDRVQSAGVILQNKVETVSPDRLREVGASRRGLNRAAEIARTERGRGDPGEVLNTGRFDDEQAASAGCIRAISDECLPEHLRRGDIVREADERRPTVGNRRQALVFIGTGLDEAKIRGRLEACVMTREELTAPVESLATLDDPFPAVELETAARPPQSV